MKPFKKLIFIFALTTQMLQGQIDLRFQTDYYFYKKNDVERKEFYKDIDGSPYLNSEFENGAFYIQDTLVIKLPIRYNIYKDEMEYQQDGVCYVMGSPLLLKKVVVGVSEFRYVPYVAKGGFFEVFESGKCTLLQKKIVDYIPSPGSKPIVGVVPARFDRRPDVFYIVLNESQVVKVSGIRSVLEALQNQKEKLESFMKQEKINNVKRENLIKIVKYYNSL